MTDAELIEKLRRLSAMADSEAWTLNSGTCADISTELDTIVEQLEQRTAAAENTWSGVRVHNRGSHRVHGVDPAEWDTAHVFSKGEHGEIKGTTLCGNPFWTTNPEIDAQNRETVRQLEWRYPYVYLRTGKPITCGNCLKVLRKQGYSIS